MISVVIPSYLGEYRRAAKDRDKKIVRAINSVLNQTIKTECIIIADGCEKTVEIIKSQFVNKVNGYLIPKQRTWAGITRNLGVEKAHNDIICYLDVDDYLETDHCERIINNFGNSEWVWFDDVVWSGGQWKSRKCNINKMGFCGTSNIAHKRLKIWPVNGDYAHDWQAVGALKKYSTNYKYIGPGGYRVCHVPGRWDV